MTPEIATKIAANDAAVAAWLKAGAVAWIAKFKEQGIQLSTVDAWYDWFGELGLLPGTTVTWQDWYDKDLKIAA